MDRIETKEIVRKEITHNLYCDNCDKFLGSAKEYPDGYYEQYGIYEHTFFLKGIGKFTMEKCLCDDCRLVLDKKIQASLIDLGFERTVN